MQRSNFGNFWVHLIFPSTPSSETTQFIHGSVQMSKTRVGYLLNENQHGRNSFKETEIYILPLYSPFRSLTFIYFHHNQKAVKPQS
jgi:hypothetical protein